MASFTYNDKTIYYTTDGDTNNETLLLLNGIMMSTKSWDPFVKDLSRDYYLLRVDFLDQGQSSKMTEDYTQSVQVKLLNSLLTHLNLSKVHLAGISYGGSIALQFAVKYPEHVEKLLLFNAVSKTSNWLKAIGDGWNAVAKTRSGLAYYHTTIPFIYSPQFYNKNNEWMEKRKKVLVPLFSDETFLEGMIRLTKSAETHDVNDQLDKITHHTLIVSSEEDYLTPPYEQRFLNNKLKNSRLVTFEATGHASMYEKPDLFITTILGFLKSQKNYQI